MQALDHIIQYLIGTQNIDFIFHTASPQTATHFPHGGNIVLRILTVALYQHHGRTLIQRRSGGKVDPCHGHASHGRYHKPVPVIQKQFDYIAKGNDVFL